MNNPKSSSVVLGMIVLAVLLGPTTATLRAQEQQPMEIQQTAGPYEVGVLTERSNLSVGRARFIITVHDAASKAPVPGAQILIRTKHQAEGTEGWSAAFGVPKFPGTYHAQTRLDSPGVWLVSIEIQGPLGDGTVLVAPMNVPDLRGYSAGSYVFIGLTLVLVGGAGYLWWSTARRNKQRESLAVTSSEAPDQSSEGSSDGSPDGP